MKLLNTLSGQKEEFQPQGEEVRMYVCGVTPYDECHLGHALSYIVFDVLRRYLEFRGYKVKHVQNFTDVDDKIIIRARERGVPPQSLAEGYIERYFQDMDALNIKRAHLYPRATQEIGPILDLVSGLIQKGYAYVAGGSVYFRVRSFPGYGKLSKRTLDGMMAGARVEAEGGKEDPMDFALWKEAHPGEPAWPSPWGPGRPGWHIECSAMSMKYLGPSLDIHGGGQDLTFPHHENERAQSEASTGSPFVRYWLHNGLMQMGQEKMSKSLGNLIPLRGALERYPPDALRLFILGSHYRSPLTYSETALLAGERAAERLRQAALAEGGGLRKAELDASPHRERFLQAMDDDLNTPQALAVLFDLARDINRARGEGQAVAQAQGVLRGLAQEVLGLTLEELKSPLESKPFADLFIQVIADLSQVDLDEEILAQHSPLGIHPDFLFPKTPADFYILSLTSIRNQLRERRHWDLADHIRARLAELGVALEDTPQGTAWKRRKLSHPPTQ